MAKKKKVSPKTQWSVVLFGAFIFVGAGLGLLSAFQAGASYQVHTQTKTANR